MSASKLVGGLLLIIGLAIAYFGLYSSDSDGLLVSSVLHFSEHMQMMWEQMPQGPRIYLTVGILIFLIGLLLSLKCPKTKSSNRFF